MDIISRSEWSSRTFTPSLITEPLRVVVAHHWSKPHATPDMTMEQELALLRGVEEFHINERGWRAIGYSWIIFPSGRVYEGRGWGVEGAHTKGANRETIGYAFAIDGQNHELSEKAKMASRVLTYIGIQERHLSHDVRFRGHRDYGSTVCPGDKVYEVLSELRPDCR